MKKPFTPQRLVGLAILASAGTASAQAGPDLNTASQNIMLLVDTSGSMELTTDGKIPQCDPTHPNTGINDTNDKSRWTSLVEVLTGTINNYSCFSEPRNSPDFKQEYAIGPGLLPAPDYNYFVADGSFNYHRALSNQCAVGPGDLATTAPWDWPSGALQAVKYRSYGGGTVAPTTYCPANTWSQKSDGLLAAYVGRARFGLMTFDTDADPGTGVASPNLTYGLIDGAEDDKNGIRGTWSYYLQSGPACRQNSPTSTALQCSSRYADGTSQPNLGGCCMGGPLTCSVLSPWEAGARNGAAPPWEGRMVAFGPSAENGVKRLGWIQDILKSTRPFGATPVAGMLNDARDFFWHDDTRDPLNKSTGDYFGPSKDPLVQSSCRQNIEVLLTDGEPNMDLRADCEGLPKDKCPYDKSEEIVNNLSNPGGTDKPVRTFVIGFGLSKVNVGGIDVDCKTIAVSDPLCSNPTDPALKICCRLNNIAYNGVPAAKRADPNEITYALFAQSKGDLFTALDTILSSTEPHNSTRTYPVVTLKAPNDTTFSDLAGYEITSGYTPSTHAAILGRNRIYCDPTTQTAQVQPFVPGQGDDLIAQVNTTSMADQRLLFTIQPPASGAWDPNQSIRPYLTSATMDDGVGLVGGLQTDFVNPSALKTSIAATTLGVIASSCTPPAASPTACSNQIVDYMSGLTSAAPYARSSKGLPNVIGFILHSTPQIRSGIPAEFLRDPTYTAFATSLAKRDTMIYTSTNDGFFHGFYLSPGDNFAAQKLDGSAGKNPERWGFVPPAALQSFVNQYPTNVANANPALPPPLNATPELDGMPVLRDVGATRDGARALNNVSASTAYYPYILERTKNPAPNETHTWRTVTAQAFGARRGGYFGMDVTTPLAAAGNHEGPKFLWQLTRDIHGKDLFSPGDPAPLLTTVFADLSAIDPGIASSSETTREIQVAILAGGAGVGPGSNRTCTNAVGTLGPLDANNPSGVKFRPALPCYDDPDSVAGRSLTIVRMDTGQIIRTFRPNGVASPVTFDSKVVTNIDIPAPISGQPAAYPGQAGQIADRIFVGDAEGRIWRVDVSNPDPSKWTMNVFFDLYWDAATAPAPNPQPLQLQPALSVDDGGQITIAVATGDQQDLTYLLSRKNYTAALVETVTTVAGVKTFNALLKWRHEFDNGEHTLGPLALFDRNVYYTTFQPPALNGITCEGGVSFIRGENYLKPNSSGIATLVGGDPAPTFPQTVADAVVTGAAIRQMPSCAANVTNGASTDPFLGYGSATTVSSVTPGPFQVFYQKSNAATNSKNEPTPVPVAAAAVTPPRIPVRIDSWAPIIE